MSFFVNSIGYQNWLGDNRLSNPYSLSNINAYHNAMNSQAPHLASDLKNIAGLGWIGSAIGSGASILGSIFTNRANARLMREQWAREDTAFQRQVEDMKRAGLNPHQINGSGASSASPVTLANPMANFGGDVSSAFDTYLDNVSARIQLDNSNMLNILRYAKLEAQNIANSYAPDVAYAKLRKLKYELEMSGFRNSTKEIDWILKTLSKVV